MRKTKIKEAFKNLDAHFFFKHQEEETPEWIENCAKYFASWLYKRGLRVKQHFFLDKTARQTPSNQIAWLNVKRRPSIYSRFRVKHGMT